MKVPALSISSYVLPVSPKQYEKQRGSAMYSRGQWGRCGGATNDHCLKKNGCRSNCSKRDAGVGSCSGGDGLSSIFTREMFEEMLPYRNDHRCPAAGFYTYDAFVAAAEFYPTFATTGDDATRKREIAAFFGQTSHETSGGRGWNAPGGSHAWGYCFNKQVNPPRDYLDLSNTKYPCVPGQKYFGRGPIQLTWNYNYGQFGATIGKEKELLENPDLLCTDPILCFQSSLWFWMTPQGLKPSCHDVIIGAWLPNDKDEAAGRLPGYGVITNIINPGECCRGCNAAGEDRIAFYKRYCDMFGVGYGDNLNCYNQRNFGKNYNDGQFGSAIGKQKQLLENPDLLLTDPTLAFKSALWFWMTPQGLKPSCHDVVVGAWMLFAMDEASGRLPGYGVITNIINGGQCGRGWNAAGKDRIGFYKRYCDMFGVSYGDYLDCYNQRDFRK